MYFAKKEIPRMFRFLKTTFFTSQYHGRYNSTKIQLTQIRPHGNLVVNDAFIDCVIKSVHVARV